MMSGDWTCWLWTVVGAGLLGWGIKGMVLGPVINDKRREVERLISKVTMLTNQPPEVRTVEKRVEVPVERVVLKHIEVPVEKIIEKRVEVPIEKTVEKVVDRPVDNPEYLARIKALEGEVAMIAGLLPQIAQFQTVASQIGGRGSEGRVVVPVDNPEQLARIKTLEDEVAEIAELRAQIAELRALSLHAGEKVVEKQIEPRSETNGEIPIDGPEQLARIKALEGEVAMIAELREQLAQLAQLAQQQAASLRAGETSVEKRYELSSEPIVVKNREVPVETIHEPAGDLDPAGAVELSNERQAAGESPDDLKQIRGVGPALERFLHKRGVFWFRQVATWSQADIDKFEFLLPNFGGRIQRENWVRSAQVEYYRKSKQWLGDGEPPSESPDLRAQMTELQATSSQAGEKNVEKQIETPAEQTVAQNGEVPVETIHEPAGDLDPAGAVELSNEGQAAGESPDDLKQIRGVGPALERFLHKRGVFWFRQVATWSQADIEKFEFLLPNFSGRIQRENWVRSAQVEYYKKYKQSLGDDGPSSTTTETHEPA
jgi:predicted flap endonuclease-1-like 5' DNA nuclease